MQARKSIDGLLGVLCAVLLLTLVGSCRDEPAETAGHETDQTVQLASERSEGELKELGREVDEAVQQTQEAAQKMIDRTVQLASRKPGREVDEAVEETDEVAKKSEHSSEEVGQE